MADLPAPLTLASSSRAEDAGYLALADLADLAHALQIRYRIVGGHMVSLAVAYSGVPGIPGRDTADADFGVPFEVAADPRLLPAVAELGYRAEAANRFVRDHDGLLLTVDVLAPSLTGQLETNQEHGELVLDAIPGLALALVREPLLLDLRVRLHTGTEQQMVVAIPDLVAALCLKALAYLSRSADRDAVDVWRLLEAAQHTGLTTADWPTSVSSTDAQLVLRQQFGRPRAPGLRQISTDPTTQTRVRALVAAVCG